MHEEFMQYLKSYKKDEFIIKEDQNDKEFYCLLQGKVGIRKGNPQDPEHLVKIKDIEDKGTYFGEMSTLLNESRTASVIAVTDVKVFQFPSEMLSEIMLKQSTLGLKLCTALADRLRRTTGKQQDVTVQRNEIRDDATNQLLNAKESFQQLFIMASAIEYQLRNPITKAFVEFMSSNPLVKGGRRLHIDQEYTKDMPECIATLIEKAYAEIS